MPHANVWYSLSMAARHDALELALWPGCGRMRGPGGMSAMWYWMGGLADRL